MSNITDWDPVDASNTGAPPDGWPEGMAASAVNDAGRAIQGSVRRYAEDGGWFDWGHAATYVSGTVFQVPGDLSAVYVLGRRVRAIQTATIYGTISGVAVTANTDVTVTWDAGALANEALAVSVGPVGQASPTSTITGEIRMWTTAQQPSGFLFCDGATLDRLQYADLFSVIGTLYGAPSGTTFSLPDFRGRSPIGPGTDGSVDNQALAVKDGVSSVALAEANLAAHTHAITFPGTAVATANSGAQVSAGSDWAHDAWPAGTDSAGSGTPHENQSPVLGINFMIAI